MTAKPRDIHAVLTAVLAEIPDNQVDLRACVEKIRADSLFVAPEIRWAKCGHEFMDVINIHFAGQSLDYMTTGWRDKMRAAWAGTP